MSQDEILQLAARFAQHLLYRDQHDQRTMREVTASADYCNLWELLGAGLDDPDPIPQVPLSEIIAFAQEALGETEYVPTVEEILDRR